MTTYLMTTCYVLLKRQTKSCHNQLRHFSSVISSWVYLLIDQVIQRGINLSLTFSRNWEDYKNGFGFLSSEFWIGNDKLSYLTNQALYELRIDITPCNGSSFYVNYNSFRISDEWSKYALASVGNFTGDVGEIFKLLPVTNPYHPDI